MIRNRMSDVSQIGGHGRIYSKVREKIKKSKRKVKEKIKKRNL